jgi:hypothetical protein
VLTFLKIDLHLNISGLSIVEGLSCKYSQDVKVDVITHMFDGTQNLMPGPCSDKKIDTNFGNRSYSKEKRQGH